jgi:hypothetical protein
MRFPRRFTVLLALGCGACAAAGAGTPVDTAAAEREVLMMIIAKHGSGAVLMDSTYGHGCMEHRTGYCDNPPAPQEPWQAYLQAASEPVLLRDLLPSDARFTYVSQLGGESGVQCERRRRKLQLSRVGLSRDGRWGVVTYGVSVPASSPMCHTGYGATVLVRRSEDGGWVVDRPLSTTIS